MSQSEVPPLVSFYYSTPHVLESILRYCTPYAFDSVRYTCKAIYSMSLEKSLLRHQLLKLIDDPSVARYQQIEKNKLNIWRLRGMFFSEIIWRESCWRVPCRKGVVEIGVKNEAEYVEIVLGSTRGDTLAVIWNGSSAKHAKWRLYKVWSSKKDGPFLRCMETPCLTPGWVPPPRKQRPSFVPPIPSIRKKPLVPRLWGELLNVFGRKLLVQKPLEVQRLSRAVQQLSGVQQPCKAVQQFGELQVDIRESADPNTYIRGRSSEGAAFFYRTSVVVETSKGNVITHHETGRIGYARDPMWRQTALIDTTDVNLRFRLGSDGACGALHHPTCNNEVSEWDVLMPDQTTRYSFLAQATELKVTFRKATTDKNGAPLGLFLSGKMSHTLTEAILAQMESTLPERGNPLEDWLIQLTFPPRNTTAPLPNLLLAAPSPSVFYRPIRADSESYHDATASMENSSLQRQSYFRIGGSDGVKSPATCVVRVVGYDDEQQIWLWDVTEQDIYACAHAGPKTRREVQGKRLDKAVNVAALATVNHEYSSKVVVITYGKEQKDNNDDGFAESDIGKLRAEDLSSPHEKVDIVESSATGEDSGCSFAEGEENKWRLLIYDLGEPKGLGSAIRLDEVGDVQLSR